jgi:hypothetical protein
MARIPRPKRHIIGNKVSRFLRPVVSGIAFETA